MATSRLPKPKINVMLPQTTSIWWRDSQPKASSRPEAVQLAQVESFDDGIRNHETVRNRRGKALVRLQLELAARLQAATAYLILTEVRNDWG